MSVVDAVEVLLVETVSFAAVTVTVFVTDPVAVAETVARIVTTAVCPGAKVGMVTVAELFAPDVTVPAAVDPMSDVPLTKVTPVGRVSATATDVAVDGPLFVTFIVYVIVLPAGSVVGPVLVTATSFCCVKVVVTVDALFVFGVSTVAVSVVLITALLTKAAVLLGRIAATI